MAAPEASDAKAVKNQIYEIEYRMEKAAKESSPAAEVEKKQSAYNQWLKKLDGARFKYYMSTDRDSGHFILDIRGNQVINGLIMTWSKFFPEDVGVYTRDSAATLDGYEFTLRSSKYSCGFNTNEKLTEKGKISEDGNFITTERCNEIRTYKRER